MKKITLLFLFGIFGCCPEFTPVAYVEPRPREATITEFNSGFDVANNLPDPKYAIHTFLFPSDMNSSGALPNDQRVQSGKVMTLKDTTFQLGGEEYRMTAVTKKPGNSTLSGDIMASVVSPIVGNSSAQLRFAGKLSAPLLPNITSASASEFITWVKTNLGDRAKIDPIANTAKLYGEGSAQNAKIRAVTYNFTKNGVLVYSQNVFPAILGGNVISASLSGALRGNISEEAVEVIVKIGEVYYYKAKNGLEFALLIEDIRQGSLTPFLNRITIKFTQLGGGTTCPTTP